MAQATDFTISNASFPAVRTDLNSVFAAINSSNSGTSRPSSATTGTFWLDTSSSGSNLLILKFFCDLINYLKQLYFHPMKHPCYPM